MTVKGCPIEFISKGDHTKVKLLTQSRKMKMGETCDVKVNKRHLYLSGLTHRNLISSGLKIRPRTYLAQNQEIF